MQISLSIGSNFGANQQARHSRLTSHAMVHGMPRAVSTRRWTDWEGD